MKSSSGTGVDVFDFKEEDELPELIAGQVMSKFRNPNHVDNPVIKYQFLESVAQGTTFDTTETGSVPCVDLDAIDCRQSCDNDVSCDPLCIAGGEVFMKDENLEFGAALQSSFKLGSHDSKSTHLELETRVSSLGPSSLGKSELNCALLDSPSRTKPVDMILDADKSMDRGTLSSLDVAENKVSFNNHRSDDSFDDLAMDDKNVDVVVCPDYVVYRGNYCTCSLLAFSQSCIKLEDLMPCENQGISKFEWGIGDIIDIECHWFRTVEMVMIKLHIQSKDAVQDDNVRATAGTEEVKFAVVDPNWSEKQEDIMSLNEKYLALWDVVIDSGESMDGGSVREEGRYFPSFGEFEDVIFPRGDVDAVSISKRDVDLLQPETFVNDTIIDFYIKYLKNQIQSEEQHRFHFFNSFFFRKLADLDKDPSSASDGRAAFLRVRKWTRKVDLFKKDYVFIPVNFNLHWSLLVVCHPGEVASFQDQDFDKSHKVPCILHMDSIKGSHAGLKNLIQSYLWEEWKERQMETSEDISLKFLNLRFVALELPQQENSFDCGLFLLHYLELFLAEAPVRFNPFTMTKFTNFLNVHWFPPVEASLKRALIEKLIFELLENHSREVSSATCSDEIQSYNLAENNKMNETGIEFLSGRCSPAIPCHGNLATSQDGQGIEMTLLEASSVRSPQCVNDSGLVLREFFEQPGDTAGSLLDQMSSFYNLKGALSSIQEDTETGEQGVFLPPGEIAFQQMASQVSGISYSANGFGDEITWSPEISRQAEHGDVDLSPETSVCASDDSEGVDIIEKCPVEDNAGFSQKEETDRGRSPSVENIEILNDGLASASMEMLETSAVQSCQDSDQMHNTNENGNPLPSCQEDPIISLNLDYDTIESGLDQVPEKTESRDAAIDDNTQMISDNLVSEMQGQEAGSLLHKDSNMVESKLDQYSDQVEIGSDDVALDNVLTIGESQGQRAAKRMRLTTPLDEEATPSESLSNDFLL